MLLIAMNSVKFHVLHSLPMYVMSGGPHCQSITLETMHIFSLTDPPHSEADHFHSVSALRFLIHGSG